MLVSSCGGGGGGAEPDSPAQQTVDLQTALSQPLGDKVSCSSLTLSSSSGVPGDTITISGVPDSFGEPGLRVIEQSDEGELIDPLMVHADSPDGEARFTTPLVPSFNPDGGEVELEFSDGTSRCPLIAFTVEALPDAPADYTLTVQQSLEAWVDESLRKLGYDPLTLLNADPSTLPPARLGLWLAKQLVSNPEQPGSIKALSSDAANDGDKLLERLLMASGFENDLDAAVLALASVPTGSYQAAVSTGSSKGMFIGNIKPPLSGPQAQATIEASSVTRQISTACEEQQFDPDRLEINSAQELSNRMLAAKQGYVFDGSTSGRALGGAALADVKGSGNAAGFAGAGVFAVATVEAARRALEPQAITSFEARAETLWVEDRPESAPLRWDQARVKAKGKSFNLGKATLNSLVTAVGMVPGPVGAATTVATTVSPGPINSTIDTLTEGSCFRIRAPEYGPINVNDKQWTKSEVIGSTVSKVDHRRYIGVDIGASELVISLLTGKFGVSGTFEERFVVEVKPIRISLIPSSTRVQQPGEVVTLSATAANAYTDPGNFTADVPSGEGQILSQSQSGDLYDVEFKTPTDRNVYPTQVRFTSQHKTLPDGAANRERLATVDNKGKATITPETACILPGKQLELTATLEGFQSGNQTVSWQTDNGQITNASGLSATFIAGSAGTAEITVTADSDSDVTDTVQYTVSEACIKKVWYPGAALSADGNGTYSTSVNSTCPDDNHDDTQVERLETDPNIIYEPPNVPPNAKLWFTRTDSISSNFTHSSTRYTIDDMDTADPSDDVCSQVSLYGGNTGSVRYGATGDGTMSLSMDANLHNSCSEYSNGDVACSGVNALAGATGFYYVTIGSEITYRITGQLSCANLDGNVSILPITGTLVRYPGGTKPAYQPTQDNNGNVITGVRNTNGTYRTPQLFSFSCTQADEVVAVDTEFVLDAPAQGEQDLIVLQIIGGLYAHPASTPKNGFGPPGTGIPMPPPEPAPGDHYTTAEFDFSVRLSPQ